MESEPEFSQTFSRAGPILVYRTWSLWIQGGISILSLFLLFFRMLFLTADILSLNLSLLPFSNTPARISLMVRNSASKS